MANRRDQALLRHVRRLFGAGTAVGLTERQLLERFASGGDEVAFEALMTRHGPTVLGVCRRVLRDPNDVEDAFQATFLILVRKASSIRRPELLGNWLYGVAFRVSSRARAGAGRMHTLKSSDEKGLVVEGDRDAERRELRSVLDEEIHRLPEKFRAPVVLCDLEGRTHAEAAQKLRCPVGTVKSRLARARGRLQVGLIRRGLAPSAVLLAMTNALEAAPIAVPAALMETTRRVALLSALGRSSLAGGISASVIALTEGGLRTMLFMKFRTVAVITLAAGIVVIGAGVFARQDQEGDEAAPQAKEASPPETKPDDPKKAESPNAVEIRDILREAAREASNVSDIYGKCNTLREIALAQARSGNREDARATYRSAVQPLKGLAQSDLNFGVAQLLELIAQSQQESGFIKEAIETVNEIQLDGNRMMALSKIATSLTRAGDTEAAFQIAETITMELLKAQLLEKIAAAQAQTAGSQAVRPRVEKASSPLAKSHLLLGIAKGVGNRELIREGKLIPLKLKELNVNHKADPGPKALEGAGKGKN